MATKEERHFSELIGIWTKLRCAKGTLVIAGESPVAVFGCGEVRDCSHAQVYAPSVQLVFSKAELWQLRCAGR